MNFFKNLVKETRFYKNPGHPKELGRRGTKPAGSELPEKSLANDGERGRRRHPKAQITIENFLLKMNYVGKITDILA